DARPRRYRHDPDLHASVGRAAARRLLRGAPPSSDRAQLSRRDSLGGPMGVTHFDQAPTYVRDHGHIQGRWTQLGIGAGSEGVGVRRIEVPAGRWSTPVHEHGLEEEIFYVLTGEGISFQGGDTAEVRAGDCIVYGANTGAHTLYATQPLDVLAFGPRKYDESPGFPRLGMSIVGSRAVDSVDGTVDGEPIQFVREGALGAPELPDRPGPRPASIVNVDDVEGIRRTH